MEEDTFTFGHRVSIYSLAIFGVLFCSSFFTGAPGFSAGFFSDPLITDGLLLTPNFLLIFNLEAEKIGLFEGNSAMDSQLSSEECDDMLETEREDTEPLLTFWASAAFSSLMTLL